VYRSRRVGHFWVRDHFDLRGFFVFFVKSAEKVTPPFETGYASIPTSRSRVG
jgi:hypothetical protein